MVGSLEIRSSTPGDLPSIESLYPDAFPDEDLLPVVKDLLQSGPMTLSVVAIVGASLVGHVIFTTCSVTGNTGKVALLAPLAVASAWQNQGIGSAMVREGLRRLEDGGFACVYVLGNPSYYRRFGFKREAHVAPPFPLPREWCGAWQSMSPGKIGCPRYGKISVPHPWLRPNLWVP